MFEPYVLTSSGFKQIITGEYQKKYKSVILSIDNTNGIISIDSVVIGVLKNATELKMLLNIVSRMYAL